MAVWLNIYRTIVLTFLTRLIVQCAYPEKYTPLQVRQQGYPVPSHTIHACCVIRIKLTF